MFEKIKQNLKKQYTAVALVLHDYVYIIIAASFALNFVALDYILLSQSTTFRIMSVQNTAFYNWSSIVLSITTAILLGISSAMIIFILKKKKSNGVESTSSTIFGTLFAAIASGCPVCGAWLLPLLGIAGSLAAFPLQGLEIRLLAIGLLLFSIVQSTNIVLGVCNPKNTRKRVWISLSVILVFIVVLLLLPNLPSQFKTRFQLSGVVAPTKTQLTRSTNAQSIYTQVNPKSGFAVPVQYGNIGYQLVQAGVIDFPKFKALYTQAGTPLNSTQLQIFSKKGLDKNIVITRENSYFLLNLFWAFGLANKNPILTQGTIAKYANVRIGDFASTGGWTIASKPLEEYFAKLSLAPLTKEQQGRLQNVAENVYRPCCGNSTAFPDCNHGMALLGVLELMASNNATEAEMFQAAKYFSAFWFPQQATDVATMFKMTEGTDFKDIDAKEFVSKQFFSGLGWSRVKSWLESNGAGTVPQTPNGGGGCGVESGAPTQTAPATRAAPTKQVVPQGGGGCGV